jgi:hypothetical protein
MPRATKRIPAAARQGGNVIDTLIMSFAQRCMQRGFVFGVKGTCVELDFQVPAVLRTDDALELDDGSLVEVVAEAEPLLEVRCGARPPGLAARRPPCAGGGKSEESAPAPRSGDGKVAGGGRHSFHCHRGAV